MKEIDDKLQEVLEQAKGLSIPVSSKIQKEVVINKRAKTRFGCCRRYKGGFVIEISAVVVSGLEQGLLQILAHEVLHTCPGCQNHSPAWKAHADKMNEHFGYKIKRTSTPQELGINENAMARKPQVVRYVFVCKKCGQRIERTRKSRLVTHTHLYKCLCGGKLEKYM